MTHSDFLARLKKLFRQRIANTGIPGTQEVVITGDSVNAGSRVYAPHTPYVIFAQRLGKEGYICIDIPESYRDVQFYPEEKIVIEWDFPGIEGPKGHFVRKISV